MTGLQALGDSFTCGRGVGLQVPGPQTWTALVAGHLGLEHRNLARPGARVRDVVEHQLPATRGASVSTLLVGLNDVVRPDFDAQTIRRDVWLLVERLSAVSDVVLLARLHDPGTQLGLPDWLRRRLLPRLDAVNDAVDEAARLTRVTVLDLARLGPLQQAGCWAVDRVHPSSTGHELLAAAGCRLLGAPRAEPAVGPGPSRAARARWKARYGTPHLLGLLTRRGRVPR